jgi:hypothetical protein
MGCERSGDVEALSDHLLALQSLLDAGDDAGQASLALRLAALCAEPPDRPRMRARLEDAFALERRAMAGAIVELEGDEADADEGLPTPRELVMEVEQYARALIRDVVCGYLDADLRSVADDILIAGGDPIEIHARDLREEEPEADLQPIAGVEPEAEPELELELEPELESQAQEQADPDPDRRFDHPAINAATRLPDGPGTAADPRSAAWAVAALPGPRTFRDAEPPRVEDRVDVEAATYDEEATIADRPLPRFEHEADEAGSDPFRNEPSPQAESTLKGSDPFRNDAGVIHSSDWDLDDDPASYGAPV